MQIGHANYMSNAALKASQTLHDEVLGEIEGCDNFLVATYSFFSTPKSGTCPQLPRELQEECVLRTGSSHSSAISLTMGALAAFTISAALF